MKVTKPENTLIGLAAKKADKLDDIHRALLNIDQRQRNDWQAHLKSKRRQVLIALFMALIGGMSLYFEIIKVSDLDIFKHRIAKLTQSEEVKVLPKLDESELLAMEDNK